MGAVFGSAASSREAADAVWEKKRLAREAKASKGGEPEGEEEKVLGYTPEEALEMQVWFLPLTLVMLLGAFGVLYLRYTWAFTELPRMASSDSGAMSAGLKALLKTPAPSGGGVRTALGNADCWDEEYNAERCCDLTISVAGDKSCWRGSEFGYNDCCDVADRVKKARFILAEGERYYNTARWLFYNSARKRHYRDAIAVWKLAMSFDKLGTELEFMIEHTVRTIKATEPQSMGDTLLEPFKNSYLNPYKLFGKIMSGGGRRGVGAAADSRPKRPPHEVLGISAEAGLKELREGYKKASRANHPDRGGDAAIFQEITEAHEAMKSALEDEF